jgi:hypothetical protein
LSAGQIHSEEELTRMLMLQDRFLWEHYRFQQQQPPAVLQATSNAGEIGFMQAPRVQMQRNPLIGRQWSVTNPSVGRVQAAGHQTAGKGSSTGTSGSKTTTTSSSLSDESIHLGQDSTNPLPTATANNSEAMSPQRIATPRKMVGSTVTVSFRDTPVEYEEKPSFFQDVPTDGAEDAAVAEAPAKRKHAAMKKKSTTTSTAARKKSASSATTTGARKTSSTSNSTTGMTKNSSTFTTSASAKKKKSTSASAIVAKKKSSTASAAAAASTKKSITTSAAVTKKKTSIRSSITVAKKSATTASDVLTSTSPTNRTLRSASRSGYAIQWTPSPDNNKKDACTQTPENIPE